MPFKLGSHPIRRTLKYLEKCDLVFKDRVKTMTLNYNVDEHFEIAAAVHPAYVPRVKPREYHSKGGPSHQGIRDFVYWNLDQVLYNNPNLQVTEFKNMTPTPFITCYTEDGEPVIFDVDGQTNSEIMSRLIKTLGKTRETLEKEALASEKKDNPANFGVGFDRYCICMVSGQVPCPGVVQLPKHWRGKYAFGLVDEEDE